MESAYKVGVELALDGGLGKVLDKIIEQFATLNKAVNATTGSLRGMSGATRAATEDARGLASAWREIARNAETAARAAGRMRTAGATAGAAAGTGAATAAAAAGVAAGVARSSPLVRLPVPTGGYENPYGGVLRNQAKRLGHDDTGRTLYGEVLPPEAAAGGPLTARGGPTVNGRVTQPGAASYGPYGAPFAGQGGAGGPPGSGPGGAGGRGWFDGRGWNRSWMTDAAGMAVPAWAGWEAGKSIWNASASVAAIRAHLIAQGFRPEQADAAVSQATRTQRDVPPSTIAGNLNIASGLMAVLQDPDAATKLMPEYARLSATLHATGHGGEGSELMAAIRSGEFRGVLSQWNPKTGREEIDASALGKFLNEIAAANIITHGQIGPAQIYSFLKAGGISAASLADPDLFFGQLAISQSMGPERAGRGLQAFGMQFSAGRMSEGAYHLLQEMGLYSKDPKTARHVGIGQMLLLPGAIDPAVQKMERDHPAQFILDELLPRMQGYLAQHYGKTYTAAPAPDKVQMEAALMQQITSRIPGGVYGVETVRNRLLIERDTAAGKAAMARDAYKIELQNNPVMQQQAFLSAFNGFEVALGNAALEPATKVLHALTDDLNKLAEWAQKNPEGTRKALESIAIGVGAFATGSAASLAMGILTGPGGFVALAAGIEATGRAFTSLPAWLINIMAGAAAGAKIGGAPGAVIGAAGGAGYSAGAPLAQWAEGYDKRHPWASNLDHWFYQHTGGWLGTAPRTSAPTGTAAAPITPSGALRVHIEGGHLDHGGTVNVGNGHDLANGVAGKMAHDLNKPPSGASGHDPSMSIGAPWGGGVGYW